MADDAQPVPQEPQQLALTNEEPVLGATYQGLDDQRVSAILALLSEPTIARAATIIGIHERTLRRWMGEPAFKRAYHAARREAFGHAIGLTQRYAPVAVTTLVRVMTDPQTPAGVKVAAAATLLRFGREGIELDDLAARLELLEQAAQSPAPLAPFPRRPSHAG